MHILWGILCILRMYNPTTLVDKIDENETGNMHTSTQKLFIMSDDCAKDATKSI